MTFSEVLTLFLKGCFIGFGTALPVGPIGLVCIRNSLAHGMVCGLVSGFGAACADAICSALAGLGVIAVSDLLVTYGVFLQFAGAAFLFYLGVATFFAKAVPLLQPGASGGLLRAYATTLVLTLTNPVTILGFAGLYAGLGIGTGKEGNVPAALIATIGVFVGSTVWWVILSSVASRFREKMNHKATSWLNRVAGSIMFGFGIAALTVGIIKWN